MDGRARCDQHPRVHPSGGALSQHREGGGRPAEQDPRAGHNGRRRFGGKEDITVEVFLALLAKHTRRPVRLVYTREESFIAQSKRLTR